MSFQVTPRSAAALILLTLRIGMRADSYLPTTGLTCVPIYQSAPNLGCSGSASQLPGVGGVHGLRIVIGGGDRGIDFPPRGLFTSFRVSGVVTGDDIPSGTSIPYEFNYTADSINPSGTSIFAAGFSPNFSAGLVVNPSSTTIFNGPAGPPDGPVGWPYPTSKHWTRTVIGSGLLVFDHGFRAGDVLTLGGNVSIGADPGGRLAFAATLEIGPLPIPESQPVWAGTVPLLLALLARLRRPRNPDAPSNRRSQE